LLLDTDTSEVLWSLISRFNSNEIVNVESWSEFYFSNNINIAKSKQYKSDLSLHRGLSHILLLTFEKGKGLVQDKKFITDKKSMRIDNLFKE